MARMHSFIMLGCVLLALSVIRGAVARLPEGRFSTAVPASFGIPADLAVYTGTAAVTRTLLQLHDTAASNDTSSLSLAQDSCSMATQQALSTPAVLNTIIGADAAMLKALKNGDKTARKRAAIRYYWLIACGGFEGDETGADTAARQIAGTKEVPQYAAAGVVDARINLIKASLALASSKPATKERCAKYHGTTMSAGYQARVLMSGGLAVQSLSSVALWAKAFEISADDVDKLMPLGLNV